VAILGRRGAEGNPPGQIPVHVRVEVLFYAAEVGGGPPAPARRLAGERGSWTLGGHRIVTSVTLGAPAASTPPRRNRLLHAFASSPSLRVIGRRLLTAIPVLFGVSFITFSLLNLLPGDAASSLLGLNATPQELKALRIRLNLNEPFFTRFGHWFGNVLSGHFGNSLASGQSVTSILGQRVPVSIELILFAFVLSVAFSIPVAVLAARHPRGFVDRCSILVSMAGLATPNFVLALLASLVFALHLRLVPVLGYVPLRQNFWENIHSMVLPAATIAFGLFCTYTRLLRADIVEQLVAEDYITTARAKGVHPWVILVRHALRNSMFGLLTLIGLNLGTLIGGTVIIEQIFALPGMGQELIQAINNRDVIVVEGVVLLIAVVIVLANLATDLLYAVLDPRIRYGRSTS